MPERQPDVDARIQRHSTVKESPWTAGCAGHDGPRPPAASDRQRWRARRKKRRRSPPPGHPVVPADRPAGHCAADPLRRRRKADGPRHRRLDTPAGAAGLDPEEAAGEREGTRGKDGHGRMTTRPLSDADSSLGTARIADPSTDRRTRQAPAAAENLVMKSCQREFLRRPHPSTASPWEAAPWPVPDAASPMESPCAPGVRPSNSPRRAAVPGKLRQIKHLQRDCGAKDYRGIGRPIAGSKGR